MKDKVLIVATTPYMIRQFLMNDIKILKDLDYKVEIATNFKSFNVIDDKSLNEFRKTLELMNINIHQISFPRNIFSISKLMKSCKEMKKLLSNNYKLMHTHTPIASVISRLASKKFKSLKVIYTAHGFHFFKGAPLFNWIFFYPIEKWLSKYTDVLITINQEDYNRAKKRFKMKRLEYVPGVGVDIQKFHIEGFDRENYRKKLGYSNKDLVFLSIGELNKNKNHEIVLKVIARLNNLNIKYMIAGQGELKEYLLDLAHKLNIENQFQLLGYRNDIPKLLNSCDIYILPSIREGLNVSLMEALASGKLCIANDIRGNRDLINECNGYLCHSEDEYFEVIKSVMTLQNKFVNSLDEKFSEKEIKKKLVNLYKKYKSEEV